MFKLLHSSMNQSHVHHIPVYITVWTNKYDPRSTPKKLSAPPEWDKLNFNHRYYNRTFITGSKSVNNSHLFYCVINKLFLGLCMITYIVWPISLSPSSYMEVGDSVPFSFNGSHYLNLFQITRSAFAYNSRALQMYSPVWPESIFHAVLGKVVGEDNRAGF